MLETRTYLSYYLRVQPSEVESMPYYELEYMVEDLRAILKKREEESSSASAATDPSASKVMAEARKGMKGMKAPSVPKLPAVSVPKVPRVK